MRTSPDGLERGAYRPRTVLALAATLVVLVTGCTVPADGPVEPAPATVTASFSEDVPPEPVQDGDGGSGCPAGVTLPAEVDPRACGPVPAGAAQFAPDALPGEFVFHGSFVLPSGNIGCDVLTDDEGGPGVTCTIAEHEFTPPPASAECRAAGIAWAGFDMDLGTDAVAGTCRSDVLSVETALGTGDGVDVAGDPVRTVAYGDMVRQGDLVCLSGTDGATCWNAETGHGFRLSRTAQVTW